jgi:acyl-CoA thioester hydrolase
MPDVHTSQFRVRYYECDAYGHVNNSNYLRYMQEAAFEASQAVGYGSKEYDQLGQLWLIHDTEIEYLQPLYYGDTVEVKTWVEDFRRVRSRRIYELRAAGDETLKARGWTDWVYLDAESYRPATIPQTMKDAFFPEGVPEEAPRREPFPDPPPPPPGALTFTQHIAWNDLDPTQHVHNAQYLAYIEEAGIKAIGSLGWPIKRALEEGIGYVARQARIEYKQQARLGDDLEIQTYLSNLRPASVLRHYLIRRQADQELVARAYVQWAMIDLESGRPRRLPPEMGDDIVSHIAGGTNV